MNSSVKIFNLQEILHLENQNLRKVNWNY